MEKNLNEFEIAQPLSNENPEDKVVGIGKFFGMTLLYFIPIVGLIICIVMSIVAKNKNVKNHARAMLIWLVLALVIGGISIAIITVKVTAFVKETISQVEQYVETFEDLSNLMNDLDEMEETLNQVNELGGLVEGFEGSDLESIVNGLENGNLSDTLGQLDTEELENLINQFDIEEIEEVISQFDTEKLEDLINQFESGEFQDFIGQFTN